MQLLRKLAFPIALLYGLVVRVRNWFYDIHLFASKSYDTPIICVGNLAVGGTGKTPMVEMLVKLLGSTRNLAILSRGYRRKTRGFLLADENSTADDLGDEPMQLATNFPHVAVAVDANRQRGIDRLEKTVAPELILLDDGFQHRKVKPHLAILLTVYGELYCNDFFLPTGNLRDSRREAKRADLIIVTKCPPGLSSDEQQSIREKLNILGHQQLLFAELRYGSILKGAGRPMSLNELKGHHFVLLTGIARPGPLVAYLEGQGLEFEHRNFGDHYYFTDQEIERLKGDGVVLTTEKDYRRMGHPPSNFYYIKVGHVLLGSGKKELEEILKRL